LFGGNIQEVYEEYKKFCNADKNNLKSQALNLIEVAKAYAKLMKPDNKLRL